METGKDKDKKEEEDNKSETDKRTDKQKKTAFDKGMQAGTDSIENSENTAKVISSQISQKKKQYQFDKLDAKLEKETAEVQTWSLSGKLDQNITTETINRPKTDDDLEIPFKMNGENHTLYFRNGKLFMASKFGELIDKLDETIKALDNTDLESIDVDGLLKIAERVIKRGKSKEGKKLTKQSRILEAAQQLITELQDLDVQNKELKEDIGTLDDLSKDAVDEVAEKHQTALDQKVASFVNSTVFKSDNNKLGRSLIIDGSGNLDWAKTGSSTNYVVISRAVAIKIKNEHGNKGDNYQSRGPVRKRDGSTQINLEMKPNDVEWNDYNDPHFTRVGYCNYHINVKT